MKVRSLGYIFSPLPITITAYRVFFADFVEIRVFVRQIMNKCRLERQLREYTKYYARRLHFQNLRERTTLADCLQLSHSCITTTRVLPATCCATTVTTEDTKPPKKIKKSGPGLMQDALFGEFSYFNPGVQPLYFLYPTPTCKNSATNATPFPLGWVAMRWMLQHTSRLPQLNRKTTNWSD